jgi:hypothetical protein
VAEASKGAGATMFVPLTTPHCQWSPGPLCFSHSKASRLLKYSDPLLQTERDKVSRRNLKNIRTCDRKSIKKVEHGITQHHLVGSTVQGPSKPEVKVLRGPQVPGQGLEGCSLGLGPGPVGQAPWVYVRTCCLLSSNMVDTMPVLRGGGIPCQKCDPHR